MLPTSVLVKTSGLFQSKGEGCNSVDDILYPIVPSETFITR